MDLTTEKYEIGVEILKKAIVAYQEKTGKKLKYIWGIPNGGVTLAIRLGAELGLTVILQKELPLEHAQELVIAEDIVDTGNTLIRLKIKELNIPVFALFKTLWCKVEPYSFAFIKDDKDCCIRFTWWESKESAGYNFTV